jgi:hypothetical protein
MAFQSLAAKSPFLLFQSSLQRLKSIKSMGSWMGGGEHYEGTNRRKLKQGFHCIKLKIGR